MPLPDAAEPGLHDDIFNFALCLMADQRQSCHHSPVEGSKLTCSRHHSWFEAIPPLVAAPAWDADGAAPSQEDGGAPSYEDLCRAHVEAIISAAAAADVQTALAARWAGLLDSQESEYSRPSCHCMTFRQQHIALTCRLRCEGSASCGCICRVSTWRQRVQPVIDAQDARETFDMRTYGQRILQRLSALSLADCAAEPRQQQQTALSEQRQPQQHAKRRKGQKGAPPKDNLSQDAQQQEQQTLGTAPLAAAISDPEQWQVSRWGPPVCCLCCCAAMV